MNNGYTHWMFMNASLSYFFFALKIIWLYLSVILTSSLLICLYFFRYVCGLRASCI